MASSASGGGSAAGPPRPSTSSSPVRSATSTDRERAIPIPLIVAVALGVLATIGLAILSTTGVGGSIASIVHQVSVGGAIVVGSATVIMGIFTAVWGRKRYVHYQEVDQLSGGNQVAPQRPKPPRRSRRQPAIPPRHTPPPTTTTTTTTTQSKPTRSQLSFRPPNPRAVQRRQASWTAANGKKKA
ncbi:MAG: hypothetical protein S4CHLAM2_00700 [Chlamydiales bacterium]|nr:hypothetical protein [Chlamydiales bacterium]